MIHLSSPPLPQSTHVNINMSGGDYTYYKLGCAGVKLLVKLEFCVQKNVVSKKFCVQKILCLKKFYVQKFLAPPSYGRVNYGGLDK